MEKQVENCLLRFKPSFLQKLKSAELANTSCTRLSSVSCNENSSFLHKLSCAETKNISCARLSPRNDKPSHTKTVSATTAFITATTYVPVLRLVLIPLPVVRQRMLQWLLIQLKLLAPLLLLLPPNT